MSGCIIHLCNAKMSKSGKAKSNTLKIKYSFHKSEFLLPFYPSPYTKALGSRYRKKIKLGKVNSLEFTYLVPKTTADKERLLLGINQVKGSFQQESSCHKWMLLKTVAKFEVAEVLFDVEWVQPFQRTDLSVDNIDQLCSILCKEMTTQIFVNMPLKNESKERLLQMRDCVPLN